MKNKIKYSAFFLFVISSFTFRSQQKQIDSLETILNAATNDKQRINVINELASACLYTDSVKFQEFISRALALSEKISYSKGKATTIKIKGNKQYLLGKFEKAMAFYLQSLAIYESVNDTAGRATLLSNIGNLYLVQRNAVKGLEYYDRAKELYNSINDRGGVASTLNNIGSAYMALANGKKAMEVYREALPIAESVNDNSLLINLLNNIGNLYYNGKDFVNASEYLLRSYKISEKINDKSGMALVCLNLSNVYGLMKDYEKSLEFGEKALYLSKEAGTAELTKNIYQSLAVTNALLKKYDVAYLYEKKYSALRDSLFDIQSGLTMHEMEAKYNNQKKQAEIEILNNENEKKRIIIYSVSGGLFFLFILFLLLFNRSRIKQRASDLLQKQKNEIERLSIVASETENVILIMDDKGKLEWVNSSFERLNGITMRDLIKLKGETIYEISNNPDIRKLIDEAVKEKKSIVYESHNKTQDGKSIWESSTLTPIFDEVGKLKKIIIIDNNVTDRKHAEELVKEQNKEILDSIHYAKRIQGALLASNTLLKNNLPEHFVLYKPKDIVSGDFYWAAKVQNEFYLVTADSTGHGVPGAFMSLLNISFLNEAINSASNTNTNEILEYVRQHIIHALKTDGSEEGGKDGMDAVICKFDFVKNVMQFSAANNPVWIISKEDGENKLTELKADKMPVGLSPRDKEPFTLHAVNLKKGDIVYTFTDGYADQFGGPKGKKFKYKQLEELLLTIANLPMKEQQNILDEKIKDWIGTLEQVDDILIIGVRI